MSRRTLRDRELRVTSVDIVRRSYTDRHAELACAAQLRCAQASPQDSNRNRRTRAGGNPRARRAESCRSSRARGKRPSREKWLVPGSCSPLSKRSQCAIVSQDPKSDPCRQCQTQNARTGSSFERARDARTDRDHAAAICLARNLRALLSLTRSAQQRASERRATHRRSRQAAACVTWPHAEPRARCETAFRSSAVCPRRQLPLPRAARRTRFARPERERLTE